MDNTLEAPDDPISIARAAELSGLSATTLRLQSRSGKLRTTKPAHDRFTTRRWLHEYLSARATAGGGRPSPLPEDYVIPE